MARLASLALFLLASVATVHVAVAGAEVAHGAPVDPVSSATRKRDATSRGMREDSRASVGSSRLTGALTTRVRREPRGSSR